MKSIKSILSFILIIAILVISIIVSLTYYSTTLKYRESEFDQYIQTESSTFSRYLSLLLWENDTVGIKNLCNEKLTNHRIQNIYVSDINNRGIFQSDNEIISYVVSVDKPIVYEDKLIGMLKISFDKSELQVLGESIFRLSFIIIILVMIITVLVIRLLIKILVMNPLQSLENILNEIKKQNYEWQYKRYIYREIQPIITSLHKLSRELFENNCQVEEKQKQLEEQNLVLIAEIEKKEKAEQMLKITDERYKLAIEFAQDGLFDWDLIHNETYYSPQWKSILGYQDEELSNSFSTWQDLISPEDANRSSKFLDDLISKKIERYELIFKMKHKDGHWVDILSRAKAIFQNGKAIRIIGTHVDFSNQKKIENELRMKNSAIENSLNGFDIVNDKGVLVYVNKAFVNMYGYENSNQLVGKNASILLEDPQIIEEYIQKLKDEGESVFERKGKRMDGTLFDALIYARLAYDVEGNEIYPTTVIDISERKKSEAKRKLLEKELMQSHKMEAIGTLAGGIAHDFNNVLSGIMGSAQLLLRPGSSLDDKGQQYVHMILDASSRAAELISKLMTFTHKEKNIISIVDLNLIIMEAVSLLENTLDKKITIELRNEAKHSKIKGNFPILENALLNICINAGHVMGNGGVIQISTENVFHNKDYCDKSAFDLKMGEYCRISIKDTGDGIPEENIDKIFEPFFTTKEQGVGTGLGLAVVYNSVIDFHGAIEVLSVVGQGTIFQLDLPCSNEDIVKDQKDQLYRGSGRILFVDDEELNRMLGMDLLQSIGYDVLLAEDGQAALDIFQGNHETIDIVILDMIMPNMNGSEVFYKMKGIDKNCKVILSSGYTENENIEKMKAAGLLALLHKPYKLTELSRLLYSLLGEEL